MTQAIAERTNASFTLTFTASGPSGLLAGLTVVTSLYDGAAAAGFEWMDMTTGVWGPTEDQQAMGEDRAAFYSLDVDISNMAGGSTQLVALYEITAGGATGGGHDVITIVTELHDISNATNVDATLAASGLILEDTGATLPATLATLATEAKQDVNDANVVLVLEDTGTTIPATLTTIDTVVDAVKVSTDAMAPAVATGVTAWVTATGFAIPGSAMDLVANAVDGAALATDAVQEIRNSILADGTPFNGASIAAILQDTDATIPALLAAIQGAGYVEGTDSLVAIRTLGGAGPWTTGAGSSAAATAAAVWDAVATAYNDAGSMGELLNGAGGAFTPAQVAAAVWTEALTPHLGADQAAQYLKDILDDTEVIGPLVATIEVDTSAMAPVVAANLNTTVGSRAVPGDAMVAASIAANAVDAAALATDAVAEIVAAVGTDLDSHGAGSWATAVGFATPGDDMALTAAQEVALVDSVWDEPQAGHTTADTFGKFIDSEISTAGGGATPSQVAIAVWDEVRAGAHETPGTFGYYVDGQISAGGGIDEAGVRSALGMAVANMDTQLGALASQASVTTIDGIVDAILLDTAAMRPQVAAGVSAWATADVSALATAAALAVVDGNVDSILAGGAAPTVQQIVDGVWDELQANHVDPLTFGLFLDSEISTAGGGGMTVQGIVDGVWDELLPINHVIPDSASDFLQAAISGGVAPSVIASAVWDALLASYVAPSTMGEIMNAFRTGELDTTTIIDALNAATSVIVNSCGQPGTTTPLLLGNIYTGHKGDQLLTPVFRNGTLMTDSELAGATQLAMEINNISTDDQYDISVGVAVGPTGHVVYTTRAGDSIFEVAGKWEYQASGLDAFGAPFMSQRMTVRVYNDVA